MVGRDGAKLGYFWRHAYQVARCGRYQGSVINPDSGSPVYLRLIAMARELVTAKGVGESADAVWKRLVEKQAEVFGVRPWRLAKEATLQAESVISAERPDR